jgi:hypothetical protein
MVAMGNYCAILENFQRFVSHRLPLFHAVTACHARPGSRCSAGFGGASNRTRTISCGHDNEDGETDESVRDEHG